MAIKGYLAQPGMDKVESFISDNSGVRYVKINFDGGIEQFAPMLNWTRNAGAMWTTNAMQFDNEILFKLPAQSDPIDLTLNFSATGSPLFGTFEIDGFYTPEGIMSDTVLLYNRIELTFAYRTSAI